MEQSTWIQPRLSKHAKILEFVISTNIQSMEEIEY